MQQGVYDFAGEEQLDRTEFFAPNRLVKQSISVGTEIRPLLSLASAYLAKRYYGVNGGQCGV